MFARVHASGRGKHHQGERKWQTNAEDMIHCISKALKRGMKQYCNLLTTIRPGQPSGGTNRNPDLPCLLLKKLSFFCSFFFYLSKVSCAIVSWYVSTFVMFCIWLSVSPLGTFIHQLKCCKKRWFFIALRAGLSRCLGRLEYILFV